MTGAEPAAATVEGADAHGDVGLEPGDEHRAAGRHVDWLVERAVDLTKGVREREPQTAVSRVVRDMDRGELVALATTLAAMLRPDVDPAVALDWLRPPMEWTDHTVAVEEGRWLDGARDHTAARGRAQWARRRRTGA